MNTRDVQWRAVPIRGFIRSLDAGAECSADDVRRWSASGLVEALSQGIVPRMSFDFLEDIERFAFERSVEEHLKHDSGGSYGVSHSGLALLIAYPSDDLDRLARGSEAFG